MGALPDGTVAAEGKDSLILPDYLERRDIPADVLTLVRIWRGKMCIRDSTGGGFITSRGINDKYRTSWKPSALMILLTNYVPKMDTDDDGFNARTLFIEWPVKFVPNPTREWERQIDRHMGKKLEAERSGILALMVRGCMDVLANGLRLSLIHI